MDDQATTLPVTTSCVHCSAPLELRSHEAVHVLACPAAHGVFIHADALQHAVRDRTADRPATEERTAEDSQGAIAIEALRERERDHACPTCGELMDKRVFAYESGIPIDVCHVHGIWLDQGELERIEAWYEAHERHLDSDRARWAGPDGELEQIEERHEREAARSAGSVHWGPVGWFVQRSSWWWARRDDR